MLILAPMQGLTELLFRRVYEQCFPRVFDLAVSPFLSLTHGNLADAWKKIVDELIARGFTYEVEWPRQMMNEAKAKS